VWILGFSRVGVGGGVMGVDDFGGPICCLAKRQKGAGVSTGGATVVAWRPRQWCGPRATREAKGGIGGGCQCTGGGRETEQQEKKGRNGRKRRGAEERGGRRERARGCCGPGLPGAGPAEERKARETPTHVQGMERRPLWGRGRQKRCGYGEAGGQATQRKRGRRGGVVSFGWFVTDGVVFVVLGGRGLEDVGVVLSSGGREGEMGG